MHEQSTNHILIKHMHVVCHVIRVVESRWLHTACGCEMAVYQLTARKLSRSLTDFIKLLEPGLPWTNTVRTLVQRAAEVFFSAQRRCDACMVQLNAVWRSTIVTSTWTNLAYVKGRYILTSIWCSKVGCQCMCCAILLRCEWLLRGYRMGR